MRLLENVEAYKVPPLSIFFFFFFGGGGDKSVNLNAAIEIPSQCRLLQQNEIENGQFLCPV